MSPSDAVPDPRGRDAASTWHHLDAALPMLRRARKELMATECEVLVEELEKIVGVVERYRDEVEQAVVAAAMLGGTDGREARR